MNRCVNESRLITAFELFKPVAMYSKKRTNLNGLSTFTFYRTNKHFDGDLVVIETTIYVLKLMVIRDVRELDDRSL